MDFPVTTLLLAPLLIYQGRKVRRVTPRLPEPQGTRSGSTPGERPLSLLLLGDSAAAGVGVAHQRQALSGGLVAALADFRLRWRLLATSGDASAELLARLTQESPCHYDVVVVSVGVNDVTSRLEASRWLTLQQRLYARIEAQFSPQWVVFSALPPMQRFPALPQPLRWYLGRRARRFNDVLADWLATQPTGLLLSPEFSREASAFASDGFHPSAEAYACWATQLAAEIRGSCGQEKALGANAGG